MFNQRTFSFILCQNVQLVIHAAVCVQCPRTLSLACFCHLTCSPPILTGTQNFAHQVPCTLTYAQFTPHNSMILPTTAYRYLILFAAAGPYAPHQRHGFILQTVAVLYQWYIVTYGGRTALYLDTGNQPVTVCHYFSTILSNPIISFFIKFASRENNLIGIFLFQFYF